MLYDSEKKISYSYRPHNNFSARPVDRIGKEQQAARFTGVVLLVSPPARCPRHMIQRRSKTVHIIIGDLNNKTIAHANIDA